MAFGQAFNNATGKVQTLLHSRPMKFGMNLQLWTLHVTQEHHSLLGELAEIGFDGVEMYLGQGDQAHFKALGDELDRMGLERCAITACEPDKNPIDPDPAVRKAAGEHLRWAVDMAVAVGAESIIETGDPSAPDAPAAQTGLGPRPRRWSRHKTQSAQPVEPITPSTKKSMPSMVPSSMTSPAAKTWLPAWSWIGPVNGCRSPATIAFLAART